jgi:protein involved in polysaccharide export with SLBB domain
VAADPFTSVLPVFGQSLFAVATTSNQPLQGAPVAPNYVIAAGDIIRVQLWAGQVQQVGQDVPVDPTGAIYLESVGRVPVAGMTLSALQTLLRQRYTKLFADFTMDVAIAQMHVVEVYVIGEVRQPGKYVLPGNATVFTALFAAGGPNAEGTLRNLSLTRADQPTLTIDLYDYLLQGARVADVPLHPGDTVFVPLSGPRVDVAGAVKRSARYELKGQQNLEQVLAMAGGLQPQAYGLRVQVRRFTGFARYETLDVDAARAGVAAGFVVQDGDRVVAEQVVSEIGNAVAVAGAVYRPGTYQLAPGLTLSGLLRQAQGLTPDSYGAWATLVRIDPQTGAYTQLGVSPLGALQGQAGADLPLLPRDRLEVYTRDAVQGLVKVTVAGQVRTPGDLVYLPGMTVRDAVLQAGGLLPDAFTAQAQLVRVLPDMRKQVLNVDLQQAMAGAAPLNLALQPNDQLTVAAVTEVGAAAQVTVAGQIKNPNQYRRYEGMKLSDLLASAGGLLPGASGVVQVTRGRYSAAPQVETARFEPGTALPVLTPNLELKDDDFVAVMGVSNFVQAPASVMVLGQIDNPGPYVLTNENATPEGVWALLQKAVLQGNAYGPGIIVYRSSDLLLSPEQQEQFQHVATAVDGQRREIKYQDVTEPAPSAATPAPLAPGMAPLTASPRPTLAVSAPAAPGTPAAPTAGISALGTAPATPVSGTVASATEAAPNGSTPDANTITPPLPGAPPIPLGAPSEATVTTPSAPAAGTTTSVPTAAPTATQVVSKGLAQAFTSQNAVTLVIPPRELQGMTFARAIPISWQELQSSQGRKGDVVLQDGDVIYVPKRPTLVMVAGAVENQGPIRWQEGLTAQDAIQQAGGLSRDSASRRMLVIRANGQTLALKTRDHLQPGDILVIPTDYIIKTARAQTSLEQILGNLANLALTWRAAAK